MNLQNLGVQELNFQELTNTDGGNPVYRWLGQMLLSEAVLAIFKADAAPVTSGSTYAPYPGVSVKVK